MKAENYPQSPNPTTMSCRSLLERPESGETGEIQPQLQGHKIIESSRPEKWIELFIPPYGFTLGFKLFDPFLRNSELHFLFDKRLCR